MLRDSSPLVDEIHESTSFAAIANGSDVEPPSCGVGYHSFRVVANPLKNSQTQLASVSLQVTLQTASRSAAVLRAGALPLLLNPTRRSSFHHNHVSPGRTLHRLPTYYGEEHAQGERYTTHHASSTTIGASSGPRTTQVACCSSEFSTALNASRSLS